MSLINPIKIRISAVIHNGKARVRKGKKGKRSIAAANKRKKSLRFSFFNNVLTLAYFTFFLEPWEIKYLRQCCLYSISPQPEQMARP